jgi:hypothetical protein
MPLASTVVHTSLLCVHICRGLCIEMAEPSLCLFWDSIAIFFNYRHLNQTV